VQNNTTAMNNFSSSVDKMSMVMQQKACLLNDTEVMEKLKQRFLDPTR